MTKPCPFALPLRSYKQTDGLWGIRSAKNRSIGRDCTEQEAAYLCQAANFHAAAGTIRSALRVLNIAAETHNVYRDEVGQKLKLYVEQALALAGKEAD